MRIITSSLAYLRISYLFAYLFESLNTLFECIFSLFQLVLCCSKLNFRLFLFLFFSDRLFKLLVETLLVLYLNFKCSDLILLDFRLKLQLLHLFFQSIDLSILVLCKGHVILHLVESLFQLTT